MINFRRSLAVLIAVLGCASESGSPPSIPPDTSIEAGSGGAAGQETSLAGAGSGGADADPELIQPKPLEESCEPTTSRRLRRLPIVEYQRLVNELVGADLPISAAFPADVQENGYDNQAGVLLVSSGNFEMFAQAAEAAAMALEPPPCAGQDCAADFAASFGRSAYGRNLSEDEIGRLLDVYGTAVETEDHDDAVRLLAQAILLSPHFLYRVELGFETDRDTWLTPEEAANALAFALTGSRPAGALIERARSNPEFLGPESLADEARRLVASEAGRAHLERFLRAWLGVNDIRNVAKVPGYFPNFTNEVKAALDAELGAFVQDALNGEGSLQALLGSPNAFMSRTTFEAIYAHDFAGETPPELSGGTFITPFNPKLRRGILSLGGWLAASSPVHRSSPVDRGIAIRTRFFCKSLPPPPAEALATSPSADDAEPLTTREKFEQHTSDATCQGCHRYIDPIGFGLEMMDGTGRYRTTEGEQAFPVDSSGALVDTDVDGPFTGPAELAAKLLESREVLDCFATQMFRFIEGRTEEPGDSCALDPIKQQFARRKATIADLAVAITTRPGALTRRVEP